MLFRSYVIQFHHFHFMLWSKLTFTQTGFSFWPLTRQNQEENIPAVEWNYFKSLPKTIRTTIHVVLFIWWPTHFNDKCETEVSIFGLEYRKSSPANHQKLKLLPNLTINLFTTELYRKADMVVQCNLLLSHYH